MANFNPKIFGHVRDSQALGGERTLPWQPPALTTSPGTGSPPTLSGMVHSALWPPFVRRQETAWWAPINRGALNLACSLGPDAVKRLSGQCKGSGTTAQQPCLNQQRLQALTKSDERAGSFRRFGIHCSEEAAPTLAHTKAMIARVETILQSMKEVLRCYPEPSFRDCTSEELVMKLPPERLQHVLKTAYGCNLCKLFASHAKLPPFGLSLGEATKGILAWLDTAEALGYTQLTISDSHCTCIPSEVGLLKNLRSLDVARIPIATLPPALGCLTDLEELSLESLSLCVDQPYAIPAEVGLLKSLKKLSLRYLPHPVFPQELGQLEKLEVLSVEVCGLTTLPPELGRLKKLKILRLSQTPVSTLPQEVGQLTNLENLELDCTTIKGLPAAIGQLKRLTRLYVWGGGCLRGPDQFMLPQEIEQLENLKQLCLNHVLLTPTPAGLWRLKNLETLELRQNRLQELAPEIWQLENLKTLRLDSNRLASLPPGLWQLEKLEELDLSRNELKDLPQGGLGQLQNLKKLSLDQHLCLRAPGQGYTLWPAQTSFR